MNNKPKKDGGDKLKNFLIKILVLPVLYEADAAGSAREDRVGHIFEIEAKDEVAALKEAIVLVKDGEGYSPVTLVAE